MRDNASTVRPRSGRPPKDEADKIAVRIVDTAAELFAAQGFAATSMEQVAAACGAGKDTIYRRFPSKLALFEAVVERARELTIERLDQEIAAASTAEDSLAGLKQVARWFLAVNLDPQLLAFKRIFLSEALVPDLGGEASYRDDPMMQRLTALVVTAQSAGALRSGDADFMAEQLLNAIALGPTVHAMLGRTTYLSGKVQDEYFEKAWELFLQGAMQR